MSEDNKIEKEDISKNEENQEDILKNEEKIYEIDSEIIYEKESGQINSDGNQYKFFFILI
jgi:hypothetical protein